MMTIKEIQKLYKKVQKAMNTVANAFDAMNRNKFATLSVQVVNIEAMRKGARTLCKIADSMAIGLDTLEAIATNENNFALYCLTNNLTLNAEPEPEDDPGDDFEGV